LDTHILIRLLTETKKLSRTQLRVLNSAVQRGEPLAFSAISLLEIALLAQQVKPVLRSSLPDFIRDVSSNPGLSLLPLTYEVALEFDSLGALRDASDRAIVATARAHRLQLVTSDRRIIDSALVPVIE
jgi:PIN domain nuclease of toxin-antitoxin system